MRADKAERLLREMRERAIVIENHPTLDLKSLHRTKVKIERQRQLDRIEEMKKLYFNAGRWAGGARDHNAKEAFLKMNDLEANENR